MEALILSLGAACLAYMVSEINNLQKQVQLLSIQVAVLEASRLKRKDDRPNSS